jgi:hypothetical protein
VSGIARLVVWNGFVARVAVGDERSSAEDEQGTGGRERVDDTNANAAFLSDRPRAAARPREPARARGRRR